SSALARSTSGLIDTSGQLVSPSSLHASMQATPSVQPVGSGSGSAKGSNRCVPLGAFVKQLGAAFTGASKSVPMQSMSTSFPATWKPVTMGFAFVKSSYEDTAV